ncbi:hydrogenase expression/formation protein [Notoacmeibacter sp. MSK16QG-6]|uniref:hydrogenase expression/formation protein n=1 Tax=Notoacmeibacter sp. MSK16QG-6 TaxID=2957982 RepID=UPI00209CA267|nr:hydrogenase expression/formation protein [Notoacmeibacter sp. MSK16QG-6]MCP1198367.1 hydrogenase expression/formation protein [Notoacmeibacter sp. MSK16QG-6]
MVNNFQLPPVGFGPGSQPTSDDGLELQYMPMPQDMRSYSPRIPDVESSADIVPALELLAEIAAAAAIAGQGGANANFDLSGLDARNRKLIAETMGEGEVAIKMMGIPAIAAQESVFAGVWCLSGAGVDQIEVGPIPDMVRQRAFNQRVPALGVRAETTPDVVNAPPLVVELVDKSADWQPGLEPHVVNLTLLPHTEEDLLWLDKALGKGSVDFLSRGYGNCRVQATGQAHVWRVQFFNSVDTLILDTFEVTDVPEVVIAAAEDLADSSERIVQVMEAVR